MKKCPSVSELVNVVDIAKQAADESGFGPLFIYPDSHDVMNKQVNKIAFSIFTTIMATMLTRVEFEGVQYGKGELEAPATDKQG